MVRVHAFSKKSRNMREVSSTPDETTIPILPYSKMLRSVWGDEHLGWDMKWIMKSRFKSSRLPLKTLSGWISFSRIFMKPWWIRFCLPTDKTGERSLTKLVISSSRWNVRWFGYQGDVEMGLRWFTLSMQHHRHGQKGGTFRAFTGWNLFRICSLGWTSQISGILVTIANKIKTLNFRKASRWFTWISLFDEHAHNLVCPQHFETQRYTKYFLVANMWRAFPSLQLRLGKPTIHDASWK